MTWCNAVNLIVRFISLPTMQSYSDIFAGIVNYLGIDSLKQCSDNWLLKLNISKCKIVSYGRHVDKNYVYHIKENNQITPLDHEESYNDLRVTFDEKLTFRDHNYIHDKVNYAICLE